MKVYYNLTQISNGWLLQHPVNSKEGVWLRNEELFFENLQKALVHIMENVGFNMGRDLRLEYIMELRKRGLLKDDGVSMHPVPGEDAFIITCINGEKLKITGNVIDVAKELYEVDKKE